MFDIGSSLREARVRQGLDFPELEELTKIRPKYLRALEDEQFDILPAPTYVRGFLRSYAEALGLDGQPFVDEYNSRFAVGEEDAPIRSRRAPQPQRARPARESRIAVLALAGIAVLTALVIAAWRFGGPEGQNVPGLAAQDQPSTRRAPGEGPRRRWSSARRQGSSWMEVRTGSSAGTAPLQRDARAGAEQAVRGAAAPARAREAAERPRAQEREPDRASRRDVLRRHVAANRPRVRRDEPARGRRSSSREASSSGESGRIATGRSSPPRRFGSASSPSAITIVGDRPDDIAHALGEAFEADLCLVSGGLGPTHDDRTVELVARVAGQALVVDAELEREIEAVSRMIAERLRRPYADFSAGVRKQATRPEGATSLGLAGTAPGLVLETDGCVVVVLPGPPRELRRLWERALESEAVRRVVERAPSRGRRTLRFFGTPESAVAEALAGAGGDGDGVEVTICAREFEIHVDIVVEPGADERAAEVERAFRESSRPLPLQ